MTLPKKHRGAHAELLATAWLLSRGFDVFKNVSPHGAVDIVAINLETGERLLIDVKSTSVGSYRRGHEMVAYENLSSRLTDEQKRLGVSELFVLRDGTCAFGP